MEHYFHINYKFTHILEFENNEYPHVDEFFGEIFYNDYENDPIKIGKVQLHLYDASLNLFDAFDRSGNTINLGNEIIDYKTAELKWKIVELVGESFNPNILVIHEMMLYPEFRNKGYGKEILSGIETFFEGKCGYVALQSFPKQHDVSVKETPEFKKYGLDKLNNEYTKAQESLNSFYENCGFIKIDRKSDCFIKNIETM